MTEFAWKTPQQTGRMPNNNKAGAVTQRQSQTFQTKVNYYCIKIGSIISCLVTRMESILVFNLLMRIQKNIRQEYKDQDGNH